MARGRKRNTTIELYIQQYVHDPENQDKTREQLAVEMSNHIEDVMGLRAPTDETLIKKISEARNRPASIQDKAWSMATLDDYPIAPDVLPRVFSIWKQLQDRNEQLTIRQAKWAARLSGFNEPDDWLIIWVQAYSETEKLHEIIKRDFETFDIDRLFAGLPPVNIGIALNKKEIKAAGFESIYNEWLEHNKPESLNPKED
ncbi:MAG: hypothetical protein JW762_01545 [Dehalococcoidales bacterium]|nr:hypothetical protein [Dehalococcoidales bacterium]